MFLPPFVSCRGEYEALSSFPGTARWVAGEAVDVAARDVCGGDAVPHGGGRGGRGCVRVHERSLFPRQDRVRASVRGAVTGHRREWDLRDHVGLWTGDARLVPHRGAD